MESSHGNCLAKTVTTPILIFPNGRSLLWEHNALCMYLMLFLNVHNSCFAVQLRGRTLENKFYKTTYTPSCLCVSRSFTTKRKILIICYITRTIWGPRSVSVNKIMNPSLSPICILLGTYILLGDRHKRNKRWNKYIIEHGRLEKSMR